MDTIIFLSIIAFLAGFIQGLTGFGSVLLSLPLLVLFLDIKTAIPVTALLGAVLSLSLLIQLRHHVDWGKIYPLCLGAIAGAPVGVWLLNRIDPQWIHWVIGAVLIIHALYSLLFHPTVHVMNTGWAYLSGFMSGCLGGAISASGPPVIVYTSIQPWSKDQIKVTLQGFFVISGIVIVAFQAIGGLVTGTVLGYFFVSLPLLFIGTWAGSLLYGRLKEESYRQALLLLMAALGLFMILK